MSIRVPPRPARYASQSEPVENLAALSATPEVSTHFSAVALAEKCRNPRLTGDSNRRDYWVTR
jgi:hypothetical protein